MLITDVFPPTIGGSGRWFWELYRRLPREDFFIAAGECRSAHEFDRNSDLRLKRLSLKFRSWGVFGPRSLAEYLTAFRRLRRIVREENIHSIHAGCTLPEGLLAWMLKRTSRIPYAVYVHGEELQVLRSSRELTWLARRVLRDADLLIANSENTSRLLAEGWPIDTSRLRVLHPGVDIEYFKPAPRAPRIREMLGWGDRPVVLTAGRLLKRKGVDVLIRAMQPISQAVPTALYAVMGDGAERDYLIALASELRLTNHVTFHRDADDALMRHAFQQCDLFALPNREVEGDIEGFGIVLLEAQACGKPVIAGNSGGTPETILPETTGKIIDCNSESTLASIVSELLLSPDRTATMGAAARDHVANDFGWANQSRKAEEVFALLGRAPTAERGDLALRSQSESAVESR